MKRSRFIFFICIVISMFLLLSINIYNILIDCDVKYNQYFFAALWYYVSASLFIVGFDIIRSYNLEKNTRKVLKKTFNKSAL